MFAGGADCSGGSNAMTGLLKQYSRDRSLQQDAAQFHDRPQGRAPASIFRQGTHPGNALTDEFLRASEHAGPSKQDAAAVPHDVFAFGALGKELDLIEGPPPSLEAMARGKAPATGQWTDDFARHTEQMAGMDTAEWQAFDEAFDAAQAHGAAGWQAEFAQFEANHPQLQQALHDPALQEQFEKAFDEAGQDVAWESEFVKQQQPANWAEEFTQKEQDGTEGDSRAALAATAGQVVDIVNESSNPKFKQSNFLQFMRRLRDQEVVVEGNKVVEQHAPVDHATATSSTWSSEFAQQQQQQPQSTSTRWTQEFTGGSGEHGTQQSQAWAGEFAATRNDTAENWAASFVEHQPEATTNTALGDQWAREFAAMHTDGAAVAEPIASGKSRLEEWTEMYRKNIAHLTDDDPAEREWDALARAWEQQAMQERATGRLEAVGREYDEYPFQVENPFLRDPTMLTAASASARGRSLHEEILEHEAVVQLDPSNAEAWRRLGLLQQENERDSAAIAAFRQALRVGTAGSTSMEQGGGGNQVSVALAIAYANENCRGDAYAELERWIMEHPVYGRAAGKTPAEWLAANEPDQHARVEQAMLHAVQMHPDTLDAELQAGLGVL
ncbi:hypothetical protein SYNPS1DRAFT_27309, partial [Syncephalis pseudoplumigaleata]